jgi:hypothetical protein
MMTGPVHYALEARDRLAEDYDVLVRPPASPISL